MNNLRTPSQIKMLDARWRPAGFNLDAKSLLDLAENRGRGLTYGHLRALRMGDPDNNHPLVIGVIPRLIEDLSVLYRVPATRRLKNSKGEVLSDDDPQSVTFSEISRRALLDSLWGTVDMRRNLLRQVAVSFHESAHHKSVQARIHNPMSYWRVPTPGSADSIDSDECVLVEVFCGPTEHESLYDLWSQDEHGWTCHRVNGSGQLTAEQPYDIDGVPPYDGLPIVLVTDSLPLGQPWLPLPESRLDFALSINAAVNDLAFIVKNQAHSLKVLNTNDPGGAKPTSDGPDELMVLPEGSNLAILQQNPAIAAINETIAAQLSMLALSESLPTDAFSANRLVLTGAALKVAERSLEARRQRQVPLAVATEHRAFEKIRAVHNAFHRQFGLERLDDDLELVLSLGTAWQPIDAREAQESGFKDMAVGASSIIDYIGERNRIDRYAAIDLYRQVQADRAQYPVALGQNPGALIDGQLPAGGEGSATAIDPQAKVEGAFNPEIGTATEGASVTSAVQRGAAPAAPADATVAAPVVGSSALALEVGKVSTAIGVIAQVSKGELTRASAVNILQVFFGLTAAESERVLGSESELTALKAENEKAAPVTTATPTD